MRKFLSGKALLFLTICGVMSLTSCHEDDDVLPMTVKLNQTQLDYNQDNIWIGVADNQPFQSQYMVFSHAGEVSPFGLIWSGFTPARIAESTDNASLDTQFMIMPQGGMSGKGTPYIVAYWNTQENATTPVENRSCRIFYSSSISGEHYSFVPTGVYVTNTCYGYYTMLKGNAFAEPFTATEYLNLVAHGVHADGSEETARFQLAGMDSTGHLKIVDTWELFSLSSLGECVELYFTMESSQNNAWGMTAPAFFAIDWLSFKAKLPGK